MKTKNIIDLVAEFLYNNSQYVSNKEQETILKKPQTRIREPEFLKQTVVLPNGTFYL